MLNKTNSFKKYLKEELRKNKNLRKKYNIELHRLDIAIKVAELREKRKMTQQQMAKKLQTSQSAVARLESGNENITIDSLYSIAEIFDKKLEVAFV